MLIDLADNMGVPLARMNSQTTERLEQLLDPGLPAVNPLDAWGTGSADAKQIMRDCLSTMLNDPDAAMGVVVHDRAPLGAIYPDYVDYMRAANNDSGKPVFLVANRQGTGTDPLVVAATHEGFPVLDGLRSFLCASRCLLNYRDFCGRVSMEQSPVDGKALRQARIRLSSGEELSEAEASSLLGSFGLPVNPAEIRKNAAGVVEAARKFGFPVVLKTAERGIQHKTEQQGVCLDILNEELLLQAYRDLSERLGPNVMVAPSIDCAGIEMVLGMVRDEQFGPLVMFGFGGINVEILNDVVFAMPPFDTTFAHQMLNRLKHRSLLGRQRDGSLPAIDVFCQTAADFSAVVAALNEHIEEIDMNPVIVHADGCIVLDALVIGRATQH